MNKKKIVFLYTEIAGYLLSCLNKAISEGFEVHLFRYPVNPEAPFEFMFDPAIKIYPSHDYSTSELIGAIGSIQAQLIICCGWIDRRYLKAVSHFSGKIPSVLAMDTAWEGSMKQWIGSMLGKLLIRKRFDFCWVTGEKQQTYACKLGFSDDLIFKGFYSADTDFFHSCYLSNHESKKKKFPKRFIYVGRYYEFKGIKNLWRAFIDLQQECPNEWELWCFGTGDVRPVEHPKIRHFGFVQANQMPQYLEETGIFVLPSHFEPWGVVVHEFAAAGFPLICSKKVGAASQFLMKNKNGFFIDDTDVTNIKTVLRNITTLNNEQLNDMSEQSAIIGMGHSPLAWVKILQSIISKAGNVRN
jgi:glycosyltransferase involved in cell wall biosynthesis